MNHKVPAFIFGASVAAWCLPTCAQDHHESDEELAKKLNNPISAMISVPFQYNYDKKLGPNDEGHKQTLNIQPVIPITLNAEWNLIARSIVPIIAQDNVFPGKSESGLGDITEEVFFSPQKPNAWGMIWGVGPVFFLPSGSDPHLSARKWGLGPTGVALVQHGPWTYGLLANHIWAVPGPNNRPNLSDTFVQPFLLYTTKEAWTFGVNSESTYDWKATEWNVPINMFVSKLQRFGRLPVSFLGGVRYWATSPEGGAHNWGLRLQVTLLFPR
jgi:hypothetical protein